MKGLFIFPILKDLGTSDGVASKNNGIVKGFRQNGVTCNVIEFYSHGVVADNKPFFHFSRFKVLRVFQYYSLAWKAIAQYSKGGVFDFLFIRMPIPFPALLSFFVSFKKLHPKARIVLEYGAYPYEEELTGIWKKLYRWSRKREKRIHKLSDLVITYSGQEKVDNLINIPINNGIDVDNVPLVSRENYTLGKINIVSVSSLKKWHAYDRMIRGIYEHIRSGGDRNFQFHIVGDGPERPKLAALVHQLKLEPYVLFHGMLKGKALDQIYNASDIALSTLGFHRIGLTNSSSLKNREYLCRGLPVVLSTTDLDLPNDKEFVKYVPGGEEPVGLDDILTFARDIYRQDNVHIKIREYAKDQVSWESKVRTVISYLEEMV